MVLPHEGETEKYSDAEIRELENYRGDVAKLSDEAMSANPERCAFVECGERAPHGLLEGWSTWIDPTHPNVSYSVCFKVSCRLRARQKAWRKVSDHQEGAQVLLKNLASATISPEEHAHVLAALVFFRQCRLGEAENRPPAIHRIATNGGQLPSLNDTQLQLLLDRLNGVDTIRVVQPDLVAKAQASLAGAAAPGKKRKTGADHYLDVVMGRRKEADDAR